MILLFLTFLTERLLLSESFFLFLRFTFMELIFTEIFFLRTPLILTLEHTLARAHLDLYRSPFESEYFTDLILDIANI